MNKASHCQLVKFLEKIEDLKQLISLIKNYSVCV